MRYEKTQDAGHEINAALPTRPTTTTTTKEEGQQQDKGETKR